MTNRFGLNMDYGVMERSADKREAAYEDVLQAEYVELWDELRKETEAFMDRFDSHPHLSAIIATIANAEGAIAESKTSGLPATEIAESVLRTKRGAYHAVLKIVDVMVQHEATRRATRTMEAR